MGGRAQGQVGHERAQQTQVGDDAVDAGGGERLAEQVERGVTTGCGRDDLRQQRVVERGHLGARLDPAVDAHAGQLRELRVRHESGAGGVLLGGVLGVHAGLDGDTARPPVPVEGVADDGVVGAVAGQAQHELDEVHAVGELGDGVLDLEAGVHLEERRLLAEGVVDELDGAGRPVLHRGHEVGGGAGDARADVVRQRGGGGLLDDLLVAPLQRAVAVADDGDAAAAVAEHLHLDVPGGTDEPFQEDARRAEVRGRQPHHPVVGLADLGGGGARLHPDAAAPAGRLEHDGQADGFGRGDGLVGGGEQPRAGQQRDVGAGRRARGRCACCRTR